MSINPKEQNINELFSINRQYRIDFYQRDYQWRREHVGKLLEDLFYRFNLEYRPDGDTTEEAISHYDWYYLNAYVTNEYAGNIYIVDGQQRLTTLALILIKLYHSSSRWELENLSGFIEAHIAGKTITGHKFWMGHDTRSDVLDDLFRNGKQTRMDLSDSDISYRNLYQNYMTIDRQIDATLSDPHKLEAFSIYFLYKVMLVRTEIQNTSDVPMVFEVINDRGERLRPYEVLKGKLLGQIDKTEIDSYHDIWQDRIHDIQRMGEEQVDAFFRFYFRSKYIETPAEYREFDGDYHKTVYEQKWNDRTQLKQNPGGVKQFITQDLDYYASLYIRIFTDSQREDAQISPHLFYNDLNDQDRQFLLIMSACNPNDENETDKIRLIARLFDMHFTILQLTGVYDSNQFTESLVSLNKSIRGKSCETIRKTYISQILSDIAAAKAAETTTPLEWNYFKDAGNFNLGIRFLRYYFARIEHFVAENINKPADSYYNLVRNTGSVYGHHVEHILANNQENLSLFEGDEELFHAERNRLGALLLLKGKDNQSSGNETYADKLRTYAGSLLWNQTLCPDFYHSNKDLEGFAQRFGIQLRTYDVFDRRAVLDRQKILFEITRLIWSCPD